MEDSKSEKESENQDISDNDNETVDENLIISYDEKNEQYLRNFNKYINSQKEILDSLNHNLNKFCENMDLARNNFNNALKNLREMCYLNDRIEFNNIFTKIYKEIANFCCRYDDFLKCLNNFIKTKIKEFFAKINSEAKTYKELFETREELKIKFLAENQRLTLKKVKIYNTEDITQFKLGEDDKSIDTERIVNDKEYAFDTICKDETDNLISDYNKFDTCNKKCLDGSKEMLKEYDKIFLDNIKKIKEEYYKLINESIKSWSYIEEFVTSINEK